MVDVTSMTNEGDSSYGSDHDNIDVGAGENNHGLYNQAHHRQFSNSRNGVV